MAGSLENIYHPLLAVVGLGFASSPLEKGVFVGGNEKGKVKFVHWEGGGVFIFIYKAEQVNLSPLGILRNRLLGTDLINDSYFQTERAIDEFLHFPVKSVGAHPFVGTDQSQEREQGDRTRLWSSSRDAAFAAPFTVWE